MRTETGRSAPRIYRRHPLEGLHRRRAHLEFCRFQDAAELHADRPQPEGTLHARPPAETCRAHDKTTLARRQIGKGDRAKRAESVYSFLIRLRRSFSPMFIVVVFFCQPPDNALLATSAMQLRIAARHAQLAHVYVVLLAPESCDLVRMLRALHICSSQPVPYLFRLSNFRKAL